MRGAPAGKHNRSIIVICERPELIASFVVCENLRDLRDLREKIPSQNSFNIFLK